MKEYRDNIMVFDERGESIKLSEWQTMYGLKHGQIGHYFSYMEWRFKQDIEDYGILTVCAPLMILLDTYREISGKPCRIASFNRDVKKQEELMRRGFKAAKHSPHVVKMAADIDLHSEEEVRKAVKDMREASNLSGVPCRIGWRSYLPNQTFIHVDVCPLYFGKHGAYANRHHPSAWENEIEW